jgi:hypothetical protein
MKLMFCEDCGDIVAPNRLDFAVRWCHCRRHAVWWENGRAGKLVLHDKLKSVAKPGDHYDGFPDGGPRAWVIGLHNAVLNSPFPLAAEDTAQLIAQADGYLFKTRGSLVIRLRPLESNDTRWSSEMPENYQGSY